VEKTTKEAQRKVLRMAEIEYIKDMYENEGLSLREIARRTKKDFRTVQKYAYCNNWSPAVKVSMEPESYPILGKYIPQINEWLEADEREPRKQRHTIIRVYNRLVKESGYTGSYSNVKRYVNRKKEETKKLREGYLPLGHPAGYAQTDFGEFKYYDGVGTAHKGHALTLSFPSSNAGWTQVFPSENQECLLEGLKRIFYHVGGVPVRLRCDNMTTAVAQVLAGSERVITDGFYRFMLHHRFIADFCNPARGNEKGNVENKVGYERRNMLVPVPVIDDFEEFNRELMRRCDEDHNRTHYQKDDLISELWGEEKKHLLTLPEYEYEVFRYESQAVNKNGFIMIDNVRYGLSPMLNGKDVQVKIYFDKIEAYYDHQLLKTYVRSYVYGEEVFDWKQYIDVLIKKPGACEHTRFFNQMPKLWQQYLSETKGRARKSALMLLNEIVKDGNESLCDEALELASEYGTIDNDSIRQCYLLISKPENRPKPLVLAPETPKTGYRPDLKAYDNLTGGAFK
jgi:transposase